MPNDIINFQHNSNGKLGCRCLTTIRPRNDYKYQKGRVISLHYKDEPICQATIMGVTHITLDQLSPAMAMLDTGYDVPEAKQIYLNIYKNRNFNWATQQFSFILLDRGKDFKVTGITEKNRVTTPDLDALISEKAAIYARDEVQFLSKVTIDPQNTNSALGIALTNAFNKGAAQAIELMNL